MEAYITKKLLNCQKTTSNPTQSYFDLSLSPKILPVPFLKICMIRKDQILSFVGKNCESLNDYFHSVFIPFNYGCSDNLMCDLTNSKQFNRRHKIYHDNVFQQLLTLTRMQDPMEFIPYSYPVALKTCNTFNIYLSFLCSELAFPSLLFHS